MRIERPTRTQRALESVGMVSIKPAQSSLITLPAPSAWEAQIVRLVKDKDQNLKILDWFLKFIIFKRAVINAPAPKISHISKLPFLYIS